MTGEGARGGRVFIEGGVEGREVMGGNVNFWRGKGAAGGATRGGGVKVVGVFV